MWEFRSAHCCRAETGSSLRGVPRLVSTHQGFSQTKLATVGVVEPRARPKVRSHAGHEGRRAEVMSANGSEKILLVSALPEHLEQIESNLQDLSQHVVTAQSG